MDELYKAYLNDVANIGSRYATANGFYLSVVSALVAVLALTEVNKPFAAVRIEIVLLVCAFAVVVCWIWRKTVEFFGDLFFAKFEVLREMEKQLAFPIFERERAILKSRNVEWLTTNERRVPIVFTWFFIVVAVLESASAIFCKTVS